MELSPMSQHYKDTLDLLLAHSREPGMGVIMCLFLYLIHDLDRLTKEVEKIRPRRDPRDSGAAI